MSAIVTLFAVAALAGADGEVAAALDAEQEAFFARDCAAMTSHWAEDLTMTVEGRTMASNHEELLALCGRIMAAMPPDPDKRMRPRIVARTIDMLTPDIAHELTLRETLRGRSSVSKIVVRTDDGWRIRHMHEAVALAGTPPPPAN